jgi:hypothetical protein
MEHETPHHKAQPTLSAILDDLDRTGFKLTGMLKRLVLSGKGEDALRFWDQGDPFYDAVCLICGIPYEERLGGMLLACTACTPVITHCFPTTGDWTRTAFTTLCRVIVEAGHMELAAEDDMRSCRFCGRGTNLWIGTQFAAPNFCDPCMDVLQEWNAREYLRLLEAHDRRGEAT